MWSDLKVYSPKLKLVQHPKIPYVYHYGKNIVCIYHLKENPMNKGSMRQHLSGKAHRVDFDTGEPINISGIPKEILAQLELQKQESKVEAKPDNFDELKRKLEFLLDDPEDVKDILGQYGFEGMIKYNVQSKLKVQKEIQFLDKYLKLSNAIKNQRNN